MEINREERGWAGHFIAADSCRFRRNTLLWTGSTYIVVSTVGNYIFQGKVEEIGLNRFYETMVFYSKNTDITYHDIDVSKQISFNSKWALNYIAHESDKDANYMHDTVVLEIMSRIESGELLLQEATE